MTVADQILDAGPELLSRIAVILFSSKLALRRTELSHPLADRDDRDGGECMFASFFVQFGGIKQNPGLYRAV
jgi:hypothetical protein